jgi:hypothetical protein
MSFHPSYRPAVGNWKNEVKRRAAPLVASWAVAMARAEDELRAEGNRFALIHEVEQRAREILARGEGR